MDLTTYVDNLRRELAVAAETGGDDARALAERLTAPLESAVRLALLDALSAAADEITRDLAPGSVDLRLRGREPSFVVTPPPADSDRQFEEPAAPQIPATPVVPDGEDGAMARINFRLAEHLKGRIEEAASQAGLSVNAWLVRAASAALESDDPGRPADRRAARGSQRYTGWVR
ncbi:MAG TPA: hypothetical protein VH352_24365 [Pseudonocardiaceae bacterium]|jgi:hypothetical protein|nr:hypothetical protein [Pseudonocardiaceae bacterium]